MKMREFIQANMREVVVWFMIAIISFYIIVGPEMKIWMKLLVIAILIFGGFEMRAKIRGKPPISEMMREGFRQGTEDFQKSMSSIKQGVELPEFDLGLPGEQRKKLRLRKKGGKRDEHKF